MGITKLQLFCYSFKTKTNFVPTKSEKYRICTAYFTLFYVVKSTRCLGLKIPKEPIVSFKVIPSHDTESSPFSVLSQPLKDFMRNLFIDLFTAAGLYSLSFVLKVWKLFKMNNQGAIIA